MKFSIEISEEQLDELARRAAELVLERVDIPAASAEGSPWLTIAEAAEYLRCDPQRIYDLRSSGRLARHKEGGRALVARSDLDGLVEVDGALSPAEQARNVA